MQTTNLSGFPERKKMIYYDNKESGKRIKELRKAKKVTQERAAYDIEYLQMDIEILSREKMEQVL